MIFSFFISINAFLLVERCFAFQNLPRVVVRKSSLTMSEDIAVMINGMPGPMALETAKVCLNRGYKVVPVGFTGPNQPAEITVEGDTDSKVVKLSPGPGLSPDAENILKKVKEDYPNIILVDYTHPSAVLNNVKAYVESNCDFVMGTTGEDPSKIQTLFSPGSNSAVIAPNMAKQIVAIQAGLLAMVKRFPSSFSGYTLTVTESHQSTKADTSGTAKAIVSHLSELTGEKFGFEQIQMLREKEKQLSFGVPEAHLRGHAYHTYSLVSADGSTSFQLQHNVCGRRVYAEGTADAVDFLNQVRAGRPEKRLYNMIDVLESGQMS